MHHPIEAPQHRHHFYHQWHCCLWMRSFQWLASVDFWWKASSCGNSVKETSYKTQKKFNMFYLVIDPCEDDVQDWCTWVFNDYCPYIFWQSLEYPICNVQCFEQMKVTQDSNRHINEQGWEKIHHDGMSNRSKLFNTST